MATYSTNLALTLMATGEQSNTWGDTTNTNLGTLLEQAISGYVTQAITDGSSANTTITIPNGATGVARNMFIEMTGALTFSTTSLIVPANKKLYFIYNNTTGGFAVTVKVSGQTGVSVPNGKKVVLVSNGTDIVNAENYIASLSVGALTSGRVPYAGTSGLLQDSANLTFNGTTLTAAGFSGPISGVVTSTSITDSGLTSGRVTYAGTAGLLQDSANLTFNGTTLTANTIGAFTLGGTVAGGGNQINNVIIGTTTPLAGAFTTLSASSSTGGIIFGGGSTSNEVVTITNGVSGGSNGLAIQNNASNTSGISFPTNSSATTAYVYMKADGRSSTTGFLKTYVNDAVVTNVTSTGLAVTGTLSATGLTLDSTGTLGLGVTPIGSSAGAFTQLQIGGGSGKSTFYGQSNDHACGLASGAYFNSSSQYVYASSTKAVSNIYAYNGSTKIQYAASGTAGNTFTPTTIADFTSTGLAVTGTLSVGSGASTSAGLITGYNGSPGYGSIWSTAITPSASNYSLVTNGSVTYLNGSSTVALTIGATPVATVTSTGLAVTGTLTLTSDTPAQFLQYGLVSAGYQQYNTFYAFRGTRASPTQVLSGDVMALNAVYAYDNTATLRLQGLTGWKATASITGVNQSAWSVMNNAGTDIISVSPTGLAVTGTLSATTSLAVGSGNSALKIDALGANNFEIYNGALTADGTNYAFAQNYTGANTQVNAASGGQVLLQIAGSTKATLDSSGNLGVGVTPSATTGSGVKGFEIGGVGDGLLGNGGASAGNIWVTCNTYFSSGFKKGASGYASMYNQSGGVHTWSVSTASGGSAGDAITFTDAMTLDASGKLLVGTTSAIGSPYIQTRTTNSTTVSSAYAWNSTDQGISLINESSTTGTGVGITMLGGSSRNSIGAIYMVQETGNSLGALAFYTGGGGLSSPYAYERARIDSSGNLLVGTTSGSFHKFNISNSSALMEMTNTNASPVGLYITYSTAAPNGTVNEFFICRDSTNNRAIMRSNGGLANYSANNVNLSDRREKTNFAPATSYLDKICAIPVQTFNYIDQNLEEDDGLTLGVVAQDVQAVAPELVMESNWANKDDEPKMRLSIYQTDLQYALMKCIQEQQAIITALTTRITALEAK